MVRANKIVITGASGFVARHLRRHLSENNFHLVSMSRKNFHELQNETRIITKAYDKKIPLSKIRDSHALIHLVGAGSQTVDASYEMVNTEYTRRAVDLCKSARIKKIVYVSGLGVSAKTSLAYFISKFKAERCIKRSGLDYTIFRPSYIVAKDDPLTRHLKREVSRKKITVPGSGRYSIQPVYVNDAVKVLSRAVFAKSFANNTVDLVGPEQIAFLKYVRLFSKETGATVKKVSLEKAYCSAIAGTKSDFGIDDLNILIGNFSGNHSRLRRLSSLKFQPVTELLKSGRLL